MSIKVETGNISFGNKAYPVVEKQKLYKKYIHSCFRFLNMIFFLLRSYI